MRLAALVHLDLEALVGRRRSARAGRRAAPLPLRRGPSARPRPPPAVRRPRGRRARARGRRRPRRPRRGRGTRPRRRRSRRPPPSGRPASPRPPARPPPRRPSRRRSPRPALHRVERHQRAQTGLQRPRRDDVHCREAASAACSAAMSTFGLFGSTTTSPSRRAVDGCDDRGRGRIHRLAPVDDDRAEALEEAPVPVAGRDGDGGADGRRLDEPELALRGLDVHVLHVHLLDDPDRGCERERPTRVVGVEMGLHGARRADDEQRVPEARRARARASPGRRPRPRRRSSCSSGSGTARGGLPRAGRARARPGSPAGARRERCPRSHARARAAPRRRRPRRPPPGAGEAGRASRRARSRRRRRSRRAPRPGRARRRLSARSASARATVRIVPSFGSRTAAYAASLAARRAAAIAAASTGDAAASDSAAPRTSCERITPEFPRAPMSAARVASRATSRGSLADERASDSTTARTVRVMFVPVSPSGTG